MSTVLGRAVSWLREGYPGGVPQRDYVALPALLRRRLTDEEVLEVAQELAAEGPPDVADIATAITKITDDMPSGGDIERVRDHLPFRGFPVSWDRR